MVIMSLLLFGMWKHLQKVIFLHQKILKLFIKTYLKVLRKTLEPSPITHVWEQELEMHTSGCLTETPTHESLTFQKVY